MKKHVCPWWLGYLLMNPLRRWLQDPDVLLVPYVRPGMIVADIGCGMGYFSIPLARLVGASGKVLCIDLQEKMLASLRRRGEKAGLLDRLQLRLCGAESLGTTDFAGKLDFALAFAVVHEVPDAAILFKEVHRALKPGGQLLFAEPRGHVRSQAFAVSVILAEEAGFTEVEKPRVSRSHAVLLRKNAARN